jgi:hypothetical protein
MEDNDIILLPEQSFFIWRLSFLSLFSFFYSIYQGHYNLCFVPGGVFITSINYWYKPDYSWRRYLDIFYVKSALIYQIIKARNAEYAFLYYLILTISILFYPLGIYFYKKKLYWYSTYAHSCIHIIANIANIILYSGYINLIK